MKSDIYDIAINVNQSWNDPNYLYEYARIVKKDTGEKIVSVFYSRNAYQAFGYHLSAQRLSDDEIGIVLDDLYLNISNTNPRAFEAMLMHEAGHIANGDFDIDTDRDEISRERMIEILKGKAAPNELAADRFAVEHCGKNAVMQMLDIIIATRKKRNTSDGEIALKQLELRKQAVKRI